LLRKLALDDIGGESRYTSVLDVDSMKTKAIVRLKFNSENRVTTILKALEPEVKKSLTERSVVELKKENESLILEIEARDTVSLRAALNSYLRWINSIVNVLEILEDIC